MLAITHYARLLAELRPDRVHVLLAGPHRAERRPRARRPSSKRTGYEGIAAEVGVDELTVEMPKEADPFSDPTATSNPFLDPLA